MEDLEPTFLDIIDKQLAVTHWGTSWFQRVKQIIIGPYYVLKDDSVLQKAHWTANNRGRYESHFVGL